MAKLAILWWLLHFSLCFAAYPRPDLSIPLFHPFQAGLAGTIDCQVMPGKLSQYYSVTWRNGNLTIATFDPRTSFHSALPGYHLHDNFSLIIYDVQSIDSSASYQCRVTIDDPQISGTTNVVYDQLDRITVAVYGMSLSVEAQSCIHKLMYL